MEQSEEPYAAPRTPVPIDHDLVAEAMLLEAMTIAEALAYLAEVPGTWSIGE